VTLWRKMAIVAKVLIKGTQRNHLPSQRKTYSD
jgi:hypothetical protein